MQETKSKKAKKGDISSKSPLPILIGFLVVVVVLMILVMLFVKSANDNNETEISLSNVLINNESPITVFSRDVVSYLQEGKCENIYYASSSNFKANFALENWLRDCQQAQAVLTGEPERLDFIEDSNPQDNLAELSYRIIGSDGKRYVLITIVKDENNTPVLERLIYTEYQFDENQKAS